MATRNRNGGKPGFYGSHNIARLILAAGVVSAAALSVSCGTSYAQSARSKPNINVASVILAEPAIETAFPIQIGPADAIPQQTFLRVRGLPPSATLTEGHAIAAGAWAVPLTSLPRLKISTPMGATSRSEITISLVAIDGSVLNEAKATLLIAPAASLAPSAKSDAAPNANTAALGPAISGMPQIRPPLDARPQVPIPPPPQISAEDRGNALKSMERGDTSFAAGNVTVARLFYQRAADLGWAPAALALAGTFDPNELARHVVVGGIQGDPAMARKWYERARALGASEATERLQRLGSR